jgi:addiction module RelE/StbE family toxin
MILNWTPQALSDVADVTERIRADDPQDANRLRDRVLLFVSKTLPAQVMIGRPGRVAGTREFVVHASYILVYRVEGGAVDILAFRHTAGLWPDRF